MEGIEGPIFNAFDMEGIGGVIGAMFCCVGGAIGAIFCVGGVIGATGATGAAGAAGAIDGTFNFGGGTVFNLIVEVVFGTILFFF